MQVNSPGDDGAQAEERGQVKDIRTQDDTGPNGLLMVGQRLRPTP